MRAMRPFLSVLILALLVLSACDSGGGDANNAQTSSITLPSYMRQGYETYHENGGVARPADAVDVFILYSPESQQYMPRIIEAFNRLSAEGKDPLTGQARASGQPPIYVSGQQPVSGSSGSAAQGIINALTAPNNASVYHPTIFQPSVSHWLTLVNYQTGREVFNLADSQATALSPVIIAMWESRVQAIRAKIGKQDISWQDLLDVLQSENGWQDYGINAGRRAVYYGHASPTISSTGLSSAISTYYACARANGFTDRRLSLDAARSDATQDCVREIEQLVRHYSDSTEDFLEYIARGPEYLDMLALEETDLICLNRGARQGDRVCNRPQERLVAIYPEEGTFWHEHPFGVVNADWVTDAQREAARTFTQFVLTEDMQRLIMAEGYRPANPNVPLEFPFVAENGVDPQKPSAVLDVPNPETILQIQQNWDVVKKRADVMVLVDVSGSMAEEDRLENAREGLIRFLDQLDPSTGVGLMSFSDTVQMWVPLGTYEQNRGALRLYIRCANDSGYVEPTSPLNGRCLQPTGSTSLYTALRTAIDVLDIQSQPDRIRAVLLLSDGQDTCEGDGCSSIEDVINKIQRTRSSTNPVIVIPIAYGEGADTSALEAIARAAATQVQSGNPDEIDDLLQLLASYF